MKNATSYVYGNYANAFSEWSAYVAVTQYAFSEEKINQLVDYYLDGIYKQLVYGIYTDISVKNRSITGKSSFDPRGTGEIERLLLSTYYRNDELEEIMQLRLGRSNRRALSASSCGRPDTLYFSGPTSKLRCVCSPPATGT